jgi:ABC-2 type transport system permease protein
MGKLIHVELYKLHTTRAPLILLALSQLIIAGGVSGLVMSGEDLRATTSLSQALGHAGLASLLTLVLGIMAVAGEYRNRTITDTYLSTPRRGRVVLAKVYAYAVAGAVFGVVNACTALVAVAVWWEAKGVPLRLTGDGAWHTIAGCFVWNIAVAVIGVGIGALVRNLTAAISVALAWIALVEGIVGQLIGDLARWLPFAGGSALANLTVSGGTIRPLSQPVAGSLLVAYAALFAVVAVSTTVRRDVT